MSGYPDLDQREGGLGPGGVLLEKPFTAEETYLSYVDEARSEHARRRRGIARRSRYVVNFPG
jgi:hypothetical protein